MRKWAHLDLDTGIYGQCHEDASSRKSSSSRRTAEEAKQPRDRGWSRLATGPEKSLPQAWSSPAPGLVFPNCGGWARGWGERRFGARSAEPGSRRDSSGTRSCHRTWQARRSRSGSSVRRQQKRRGGATQGRRLDEELEEERGAERPDPPCVLSGGKGRGNRPREGDASWLGGEPSSGCGALLRSHERKVFSRRFRPARALWAQPPESSERAPSQPSSGETRAAMPAGCTRSPAAGDGRLRLVRLALVLLGWVSSSSLSSSASSSTSSASFVANAVTAQPPLPGHCPPACECSEAARTVKCVNRNLTEVPADLPHYVRNLFLTGNQLTALPSGAFARQPPLSELAALNLSGSRLQDVREYAFEHLPSLRQLDLSYNPLTNLSSHAFLGINSSNNASILDPSPLEELYLNHIVPPEEQEKRSFEGVVAEALRAGQALRGLQRLELASNHFLYLPRDVLAQLPNLRHLDLRNNSLVSLTYVSFRNLIHLEDLHLEDNALKVLHNGTLAELQGLPHVRVFMDSNPWVCDCQMADMVAWLKETEIVKGKARLTCAFPEKMRNRVLLELNSSDLDCDPILPPSLQTSYVFLGIVLALIGAIFLLVLYLNRKGIKKWMHNIRDACRDHMEGYHYRYEINADPRLTNLSSNSDV
ncbi:Trophoblast glycoprotein [Galemys pyrenaicus]|uniref:Trophoblast glycoprotein n=1 Tax=Galemys pyrenaicus TaxID=202257 RepID=A0A8J6A8T6_GALPY|nr:Trophoblast glycoprotein [Galemys pyrenaicus]